MKQEQLLKEIHEAVVDIRINQAKDNVKIKSLREDVDENTKDVDSLKADNWKLKGAGILIGIIANLSRFWDGIFK